MRRSYPDLRYKYVRGLMRHERDQRRHHFLKQAAEWTSKAIVSLSLTDTPIRSVKQAQTLEGVGGVICKKLKEIGDNETITADPPSDGKYISSAAALLVAMLNAYEELQRQTRKDKVLIPEGTLKEFASPICEEYFIDNAHTDEPAWWRLTVLISRGLIKKRSQNRQPVYELLDEGFEVAHRLRGTTPTEVQTEATGSACQHHAPTRHTKAEVPEGKGPDALYQNDDGSDGLVLLVDIHEQGGDGCRLGELSRWLTEFGVRHKTRHLSCGDYCWLWRCHGEERILPVLVERKRADDLAWSLKDGRYFRQKQQMLEWKKRFSCHDLDVTLKYIIESKPESYRVRCGDDCGGVARCGNPTVEQVNNVIAELESNPDFDVIHTPNIQGTVDFLTSVSLELQQRLNSGDFDCLVLTDKVPMSVDICDEGPVASCEICCSSKTRQSKSQSADHNVKPQSRKSKGSLCDDDNNNDDSKMNYGDGKVSVKATDEFDYACLARHGTNQTKTFNNAGIRHRQGSVDSRERRILPIGGIAAPERNPQSRNQHARSSRWPSQSEKSGRELCVESESVADSRISTIGGSRVAANKDILSARHTHFKKSGVSAGSSNTLRSNLKDIQILPPEGNGSSDEDLPRSAKSPRPTLSSIGGVFERQKSPPSSSASTQTLSAIGGVFKTQNTRAFTEGLHGSDRAAGGGRRVTSVDEEYGVSPARRRQRETAFHLTPSTSAVSGRDTPGAKNTTFGSSSDTSASSFPPPSRQKTESGTDSGALSDRQWSTPTQSKRHSVTGLSSQPTTATTRKRHTYTPLPTFDSDSDDSSSRYLPCPKQAKRKTMPDTKKDKQLTLQHSSGSLMTRNNRNNTKLNSHVSTAIEYFQDNNTSLSDDELFEPFLPTTCSATRQSDEKVPGDVLSERVTPNIYTSIKRGIISDDDDDGSTDGRGDNQSKISTVLTVLPDVSQARVRHALQMSHGSVEGAIERLLEGAPTRGSGHHGDSLAPPTSGPANPTACSSLPNIVDMELDYAAGLNVIDLTDSQ